MASGPSRGLLAACVIIVHIGCDEAQVPVSLPFQCSFESDDLCGMTQRTDDHFNWTRYTGPTPSRLRGTGPDSAADRDYYIYIEATDHRDGERAIIETPPLRFSGAICVQFWYHMYTHYPLSMGRLVVFAESQGEGNPLFDVGGVNKGDQWIPEQITVTGLMNDDKIVFLNKERDNFRGDMPLDMIDIQGGTCNACSLNNGGCDTRCIPDGEGRRCECDVGYHLDGDGVRCFDDNECAANDGGGDCSHTCDNTPGSYTCSCPTGYELEANDRTCRDIDECAANGGKGDCGHQCYNTPGSYRCDCDSGYTLNGDQQSCDDVTSPPTTTTTSTPTTPPPNECLADHECDQFCHNTHEGYFCSCRDSFLLADDKRHCIDCRVAYHRQLDASQAFTSLCPTIETYLNVPLTTCLIHACADNATVMTYRNSVCSVKLCVGSNLRLDPSSGSSGWDIYVLNTTWTGSRPEDASSFPLWQLLTGVFVGAAALGAIIAVVTVCIRKRISSSEGEGRTPYENAEVFTRHETTAENPATQSEGGVYDEVFAPDIQKTRGPNDVMVYNNTAFHGDGPYQELGPTEQPTSTAYQGIN